MSGPSGSRTCHVVKKELEEFEFFLSADTDRKGQIITSVTEDGPAYRGGLKDGDRILEINGTNVEQKDHNDIVAIIRECIPSNEITFLVVDREHDPNHKVKQPSRQSSTIEPRPRICKIKNKGSGFGFFLERDTSGDFVKGITKGSASDGTGLKEGDRVIAVGKTNVEKMSHQQVVAAIKASGTKLVLLVIDQEGYDHCKANNIPITEKMARGSTSSSRSSSSSSSKKKSTKKLTSTKSKQSAVKSVVKNRNNPHKGKVRVVHMLKHPKDGYGFFLKSRQGIKGEFVGKIDVKSPADMAGLVEDDHVVAVNGKSIMSINHKDVITAIKVKNTQVVLVVLDDEAMKHLEEKDDFPGEDDIVRMQNPAIRTVKLTKGSSGYGLSLKVEKDTSFHILADITESGVAGEAGLKNGEILIAVNGNGVLTDSHAQCVEKIKNAGTSVELTVASKSTADFLKASTVTITLDLIKEWPTEKELEVPPFAKSSIKKDVVEAVQAAKDDDKLGMKPRLCRVVRGPKGYGFMLKDENGHYLVQIADGGPAFNAGILDYDRIVEVNDRNVEKISHKELVQMIKESGNEVTFLVVNKEEDTYFKEKGILITSALLKEDLDDSHKPRICKLIKTDAGYGFHLMGEPGREGQFIKEVQSGSAAELGGLRNGDKIIEVNGSNVAKASHDVVVKKITENKSEVTFLVIDKEGEAHYSVKGIEIVATMAIAKEKMEDKSDEAVEQQSIGEASAASSIVETEVTVHQEPEAEEPLKEAAVVAAALEEVKDEIEERKESDAASDEVKITDDEPTREEIVEEIWENVEEKREDEDAEIELDENKVAAVAAATAVAEEIMGSDENISQASEKYDAEEEKLEVHPEVQEAVDDLKEVMEEKLEMNEEKEVEVEKEDEEDLVGSSLKDEVAIATAAAAIAVEKREDESRESSRAPSPVHEPEKDIEPQEDEHPIREQMEEMREEEPKEMMEDAVAMVTNEIHEQRESDDNDEKESVTDEDVIKTAAMVKAALVHEQLREVTEKKEEHKEPEHERPKSSPVVVAVVQQPQTPPPTPVVVQKETPKPLPQKQDPIPLAVILTANGDIPKLKPTPQPSNQPKVVWGRQNLRPVTKQISIGSATTSVVKPEEMNGNGPAKMSTVAALKAAIEKRNREKQSASRNNVQDELAELSKQSGGASKRIEMFGGSNKKSSANGPKKNPWVGEGMTIKIIET